jgi:iron complex outermembrane receptor protein
MRSMTFRSMSWLLTLAALAPGARAADTQPPMQGLKEVIVTAERRSQNIQNVPMSITAITTSTIAQQAITDFFDYANKVPNLSFAMQGDGVANSRTIAIRGISGENTTGFYIDDTPVPESLDPRILDIARIEVLRGPQGTLYGARSMAGTVRIITQAPNFERFYGHAQLNAGDTAHTVRGNYTGEAVANVPLIKGRAALRVSGFYDSQAGWLTRTFCTDPATAGVTCFPQSGGALVSKVHNVAAMDTYGGAASVAFKVTDNFTIMPRVMIQRSSYNGFPMADALTEPGPIGYPYPAGSQAFTLPRLVPTNLNQGRFYNIPEGGYDYWHLYSLTAHWDTGKGTLVSSTSYFDRKVFETEDQTDFVWSALLPAVAANPAYPSIPGFPANAISPTTGLPLPIASSISELKDYQEFVQEVRYVSALSGPFQFVTGLYYYDLHGAIPFASDYPPALAPGYGAELTAADTCGLVGLCPNPNNPDEIFGQHYRTDSKEPAAYGQVSYEITHALKATAGLRWSQDETTGGGYLEGSVTQAPGAPGRIIDTTATIKQNSVTPLVQVDYRFNPDLMVYSMAAKGFRPGGLVPSVPPAICGGQLPAGVSFGDTRKYGSDSLWDYEVGTKSDWLGRRLQANADVFYIDWNNIQQFILLPCGFQYIANAGAAVSKGGELELSARPVDPLELSVGIGYNNAKITQTSTFSPQRVGDPVFNVPDWTGNASVAWTQPLSVGWTMVASMDYSYTGNRHSADNLVNVSGVFQTRLLPHYQLLGARLAFDHDIWEFAVVGRNLTNEYADLGDSRSLAAETPGRPRLLMNQPRTIELQARVSF